ncbi:MAG: pilin [Patescibacteria group bacterium]|nr:pilin [Patescibacteria group bacterium]
MGVDWETFVPECLETTEKGDKVATLKCLPAVFHNGLIWALILAGVVAVIIVIISGIKFITSGGDQKQVEGAKKTLTYAIIGLVIILLSYFIISFISYITGVGCIKSFGFDVCLNK